MDIALFSSSYDIQIFFSIFAKVLCYPLFCYRGLMPLCYYIFDFCTSLVQPGRLFIQKDIHGAIIMVYDSNILGRHVTLNHLPFSKLFIMFWFLIFFPVWCFEFHTTQDSFLLMKMLKPTLLRYLEWYYFVFSCDPQFLLEGIVSLVLGKAMNSRIMEVLLLHGRTFRSKN